MRRELYRLYPVMAVALFCLCAQSQTKSKAAHKAAPKAAAAPDQPQRVKIAEGRYELKKTDGTLERAFAEAWALYKTNLGYELDEQWEVGSEGGNESKVIDVHVTFAPGLLPIQVR